MPDAFESGVTNFAGTRRTPTSANRFAPGSIIAGRYRLVALIGKGGMGEVYRAEDLTLDQPVALKFLPDTVAADAVHLAQFHNELRVARIIQFLTIGTITFAIFRFGLLVTAVMIIVDNIPSAVPMMPHPAWAALPGNLSMLLVVAVACFGFYAARAGQPLLGKLD